MKTATLLILPLIAALLLIAGCSSSDDQHNQTNDTRSQTTPEQPLAQEPAADQQTEEPPKPAKETQEPDTPSLELDAIEVEISSLKIKTVDYGEDEEYELRMILSQDQYNNLAAATIAFTPACTEEESMVILLNSKPFFTEILDCDRAYTVAIPLGDFVEGQNKLLFQSNVDETFLLKDITLTLDHGETQTYPAEDFLFEPGGADAKTFRELDGIAFTNAIERTFKLTEEQLAKDLTFSFDVRENKGVLEIELNGETIYTEEDLEKDDYELELPKAYLQEGKNTLTFIVG